MQPNDITETGGGEVTRRRVLGSVGVAGVGATGIAGATARTSTVCDPRWEVGTCVATVEDVPVRDGCGDEDGTTVPAGTEAVILDYTCCGEGDEYYYVEWCEADYPEGLVEEPALERVSSCCGFCSFRWEVETCVVTTGAEVPLYEDDCAADPETVTTSGATGIIHERVCCEDGEGNLVPRYLIEWCHAELPDGWVDQTDLTASDGCCDSCEPRWEPETCVETAVDGVPIFDEECSGDPIEQLPQGMEATVLEGGCCEGPTGPTPGYYVEWCHPDLPVAWIRQADLVESSDCCERCEFERDVDDCVRVRFDETPIFDAACATEPVSVEARAVVADRRCCEVDGELRPRYALEWCDSTLPDGWVDGAAVVGSARCCDCDLQLEPGQCVITYDYSVALYPEPCAGEYEVLIPERTNGIVREGACCEFNGDPWKGYYVEWCDPDLRDGWVGDFAVSPSDGCCDEQ